MNTKILILILALAVANVTAESQLIRGFGIKVGTVAADQRWDYASPFVSALKTDNYWGFTAAGFVEFLDLPFFSLVTEMQYTQKGMNTTIPVVSTLSPDGTGEYRTLGPRIDYMAIPVLAKFRLPLSVAEPYLIAGPRLDLFLSGRGGFTAVTDNFAGSEWGATFGGGLEVNAFSGIQLLAECRYNINLKDSFDNSLLKVKNRSLDVLIGMRI